MTKQSTTRDQNFPSFVIHHSADGQIYFNLRAPNHEIILTSETYTTLSSAKNGIESVRTHSPQDVSYDRRLSAADEPYFVLRANNHEIIGTSEMYSSLQAREIGIAAVKRWATEAEVLDRR